MSDSDYTPLASLSGEVKTERAAAIDECHELIAEVESIIRRAVNVADQDFHKLLARLAHLKDHPHLRHSDD